ncbi:MAG: beta-lactamase family protein [Clostridiaceae bacterium]|nr:beta-lactamase family protein [Clostridiaceae bacterium]
MNEMIIKGKVPFSPKEANYQEERLEVLNKHFLEMVEKKELVSGSYCLSRNNKVFADTGIGNLSFEEKDERVFAPDTIFRIASITKLFTAISILKLVEDGKLRVNQFVGEFIEEFNTPPYNTITIVHLLTHTSGLISDEGVHEDKYYQNWWKLVEDNNADKWMEAILKKGLQRMPGKEWSYSTVGYMILGEIITRVSGMFCNDYIEKYIVEPCEMTDTCFGMKVEFAHRYNFRTPWMAGDIKKFMAGEEKSNGWELIPSTGGGLYSTSRDLIKFGNMIINNGCHNGKRIVGRKALEAMQRIHTSPEVKDYCWGAQGSYHAYGLGSEIFQASNEEQFVTPGLLSHEGFGGCCIMIDVKEKFVAVWVPQFYEGQWYAHAFRNVASIMWSGLE